MERNGNITAAVVDIHTTSVTCSSKTNRFLVEPQATLSFEGLLHFSIPKNLRFLKLNQLRDINIASENMMKGNSVR